MRDKYGEAVAREFQEYILTWEVFARRFPQKRSRPRVIIDEINQTLPQIIGTIVTDIAGTCGRVKLNKPPGWDNNVEKLKKEMPLPRMKEEIDACYIGHWEDER